MRRTARTMRTRADTARPPDDVSNLTGALVGDTPAPPALQTRRS